METIKRFIKLFWNNYLKTESNNHSLSWDKKELWQSTSLFTSSSSAGLVLHQKFQIGFWSHTVHSGLTELSQWFLLAPWILGIFSGAWDSIEAYLSKSIIFLDFMHFSKVLMTKQLYLTFLLGWRRNWLVVFHNRYIYSEKVCWNQNFKVYLGISELPLGKNSFIHGSKFCCC